jgi:hypothetical protein
VVLQAVSAILGLLDVILYVHRNCLRSSLSIRRLYSLQGRHEETEREVLMAMVRHPGAGNGKL